MKKYLLCVDNGGTYIKASLYDMQGNSLGVAREYNAVLSPFPGAHEYNQDTLWEINCRCMKQVIRDTDIDPEEIACIGISGQGCGFYAIDKDGKSIRNAISSADRRACSYADRWNSDGTSQRLYPLLCRHITSGHINCILAWLKDNEPENYARIHTLFAMKDLLVYRLTGNIIASYGCQSASCLMNMHTLEFDPAIAEAFGIPEMADKFGPLHWDTEQVGTVTPEAAAMCGCAPGTPVSAGLHDVIASCLAMGITDSELCFVITGTHAINGYISPVPVLNGSIRFNERFAFPGMFLIEEGHPASSATLEWVIDVLFDRSSHPPKELYAQINRMVEGVSPTENCPVFLPHLRGNRDNAYAQGCWIGLKPEHSRAHMLRAVYEGVVFSHMMQLEHLFANRDRPPKVRIAGGATNSRVWMQIFADALQLPVELVPKEEMGAKGAAIAAAVSCGMYPDVQAAVQGMTHPGETLNPNPGNAPLYAEKYARYQRALAATDPIWQEFN